MLSANQMTEFSKMYYLKKKMNDEVYFWHADKHRSLLQVDTAILGVSNHSCPKYPQLEVCISLQYFQKSLRAEVYNIFVISEGKREG